MEEQRASMSEEETKYAKWYYWHRFSLLPTLRIRKADHQNTVSFHFHWLALRVWSIDSVSLGIEVRIEEDFAARAYLPYLIVGVWIPIFPMNLLQRNLWRRSQWQKEIYARE